MPVNQGLRDVIPEPNRIGASTPYDFEAKNLTAYGGLLPVASMLETSDIDSMQQVIHVRNGKGGRDRLVPMSGKLYGLLRAYYKHERPLQPWLFTSRAGKPLCHETARRASRQARALIGQHARNRSLVKGQALRLADELFGAAVAIHLGG